MEKAWEVNPEEIFGVAVPKSLGSDISCNDNDAKLYWSLPFPNNYW